MYRQDRAAELNACTVRCQPAAPHNTAVVHTRRPGSLIDWECKWDVWIRFNLFCEPVRLPISPTTQSSNYTALSVCCNFEYRFLRIIITQFPYFITKFKRLSNKLMLLLPPKVEKHPIFRACVMNKAPCRCLRAYTYLQLCN